MSKRKGGFWTYQAPEPPLAPPCYTQDEWESLTPGMRRAIMRDNPNLGRDLFNANDKPRPASEEHPILRAQKDIIVPITVMRLTFGDG